MLRPNSTRKSPAHRHREDTSVFQEASVIQSPLALQTISVHLSR